MATVKAPGKIACYHCGEDCDDARIHSGNKVFCCEGCKMVYGIINQSGLCNYYELSQSPGSSQKIKVRDGKFAFLDNKDISAKLIHFNEGKQAHVIFYLPQMHCSSCIWLLEHLPRLNNNIKSSTVNFLKREVTVVFDTEHCSLRAIAELLTSIGYEPHISLRDMDNSKLKTYDRSRIYKIGIAGFCFANIMLLSFPEYFSGGDMQETALKKTFSFFNLALALPVFFYCASEFFMSAYKSIRQKFLNIDAPIALAILITFARSVYEISTQSGAGYLDSMSGIVFFMLLGRFFQNKTYETLAFDRDFRSYFPIGVTRLVNGLEEQIPVADIKKGDRLKIHSHEIVPADGLLFLGKGNIDYSFVTGESLPVAKVTGELVYAGGKQIGAAIEIEVVKEVSQSYLTQLWNNDAFKKQQDEKKTSFVHRVSRYFTYLLFSIALVTATYWLMNDAARAWNAVTAVLIVACPCALLLSATFTNGNMLSKLQKAGLFVKNAGALESLAEADSIVFDKTGTISLQKESTIHFECGALDVYEEQLLRSLAVQSGHPLSKAIAAALPLQKLLPVKNFIEEKGKGSEADIDGQHVKLGSEEFITGQHSLHHMSSSRVFVSVNGTVPGYFAIKTAYRHGLAGLIFRLGRRYRLALVSGDNNAEEHTLRALFGHGAELLFKQSPQQKLSYIEQLQQQGRKVIMVGDGLNDAGALQQSHAGIVISDDINNFSPACDAILDGGQFAQLGRMLAYCRKQKNIIYGSFIISILYNMVGLWYAVQGHLSPVIAAILMPLSSASIVLYTTLMSAWLGRRLKK